MIGHIEEIVISKNWQFIVGQNFKNIQNNFLNENCDIFENSEENKLCYTEIHQKYVKKIM